MAETGVVASILGVAGAGVRLSLILNAISCEVANAPLEIQHISKTVTLFSLMLKQTGNALQVANSVHSREAVEAAEEVANESNRVFEEINDMLERCRTKGPDAFSTPSIHQRFKWCFKQDRITYLLGQLESLKLNLSLMLQILQLGKSMAATSKTDSPEEVEVKSAAIKQERVEAQNIVIVRYMQNEKVEQLYQACQQNGTRSPLELPASPTSDTSSILTIEAPPEYSSSTALVRLPVYSLGEIDQMMHKMRNSSKDMVQVSDQVIDPLLEKWTRWHDIREDRHARQANNRFVPKVDSLCEDEEDAPFHERYAGRDESPRGLYIEGTTTDWRQPHSVAARQEAARRKKQYSGYQPSVSAVSTDVEDSPGSNGSNKRRTKRHVINSSSESSESEQEKHHRRKDSGFAGPDNKPRLQEAAPIGRSLAQGPNTSPRIPPPPTSTYPPAGQRGSLSPQYMPPQHYRPLATPDQQMQHHSNSSPLPPVYTHNVTHQLGTSPSSYQNHPPYYGQLSPQSSRGYPQYRSPGPRPVSREGSGGRSPSRLSHDSNLYYTKSRDRRNSREEKRTSRESKTKNLRDGAAKGILGAGAIAGFLEALEGLSL